LIEVSKHRVQGIQPLKIHDEIIKTSERHRVSSFGVEYFVVNEMTTVWSSGE
jgi:hypothetical protein